MKNKTSVWKKLHRWPGLVIAFILLYYGVTGIFMNHRELFSGVDISRKVLPSVYQYHHWNNAALKGDLLLNKDSILVFGNIGIWCTDSTFQTYKSWNKGLPEGSDHHKVFDLALTPDGNLYAATLMGFYVYNRKTGSWFSLPMPDQNARFTGITFCEDTLYVVNRSFLFKGLSAGLNTRFKRIALPAPEGYQNKVTLFSTLWQIHSGEIMGLPGKLFVDLLGLVVILLSLTGIFYFFLPKWIRKRKQLNEAAGKLPSMNRWSLRWHNRVGAWTFILVMILFLTGIFLRPPLLIAIARAEVPPLKYSHLDQPNPWYDKLRDILYDPDRKIMLLSTSEGIYYTTPELICPVKFINQPPVSVMGINVFQPAGQGAFLVGSFSGLFLWHPDHPEVLNYMTGAVYEEPASGRPVGDFKITGVLNSEIDHIRIVDYDQGIISFKPQDRFPEMPVTMRQQLGMSLWNVCLEIHTGRIFQNLLGDFYILVVPLSGLLGLMVVLSGYLLWRKSYKKKRKILTGDSL